MSLSGFATRRSRAESDLCAPFDYMQQPAVITVLISSLLISSSQGTVVAVAFRVLLQGCDETMALVHLLKTRYLYSHIVAKDLEKVQASSRRRIIQAASSLPVRLDSMAITTHGLNVIRE